jgi:hypothetical protein
MHAAALFAALTVTSPEAVGCPDSTVIVRRLGDAGVQLRPDDDVRVRFSMNGRTRVAEIDVPGATSRRIEDDKQDCASLGEATIALLTVLLDELATRPHVEPKREPPPPPAEEPPRPLRIEAGVIASNGIVAPIAAGIAIGASFRAWRWGSIGLVLEGHPPRDHARGPGVVRVAAASGALVGCGGVASLVYSLEGCLFAHLGIAALSAEGFPVVESTERFIAGGEAAIRAAYFFVPALGVFLRAGVWVPLTRLDVAVRGADPAFSTTSIGPKGVLGMELRL